MVQCAYRAFVLAAFAPFVANAADDRDLLSLSLHELTGIKVYSASKKSEDPLYSPSAIYVITQEDLKQMGVTHLADALRTVPGFQVANLSSNKWMVASRGFGEQFANKLLVLIDGRPIYSTLYSGVTWDQFDLVFDDIKQIEVIRGPGATIWGSNAVNGVVNIITKPPQETIGNYSNLIIGTDDKFVGEARAGRKLSETSYLRTSLKLRDHNSFDTVSYVPGYRDDWINGTLQFRYDNEFNYRNNFSVMGGVYGGNENQLYRTPSLSPPYVDISLATETFRSFYLMSNWQHGLEDGSDLHLSSYIDYSHWNFIRGSFDTKTFNADIQHDLDLDSRHEVTWGSGYKIVASSIDNTDWFLYNPANRTAHYFNIFAQDEIELIVKSLYLTLGTKLESNSFVKFSHQPSAKLAWRTTPSSMLWGSVARAVRIPSVGTQDLSLQLVGTSTGYISRIGNEYFNPEELIAYEIGYKTTPTTGLSLDATAYYNAYDKLRTFELGTPFSNIAVPLHIANNGKAEVYGFELTAKYQPQTNLWFSASYSYAYLDLELDGNSVDQVFLTDEGKWPQQTFNIRQSYGFTEKMRWNNSLYYMDSLPSIQVKSYLRYDTNLIWEYAEGIELSAAAENLISGTHREYSAPLYGFPTEVGPNYYLRITAHF